MEHRGKLELTWVGKYEESVIEPRILIEDLEKSYGDPRSENMLIHGDNLIALQALQQDFAGRIKCIYIDPPYNTGSAFEYYDDCLEHSIWLNLMRRRLILLRELLSDDGTIWIHIDDEEQAYLKVVCDEVFGRGNFVNMISVNMKNIAGVSGGGEDKRLKKNCEYILIYAKDYTLLPLFNGPYTYTEISELVQQYEEEGKSWKYTTVLLDPGEKVYIGSTVDGDGNEIKVYLRKNPSMMSVRQVAARDGITEKEVYQKYGISIFQTTNAQSSIRTRVMEYRAEQGITEDLISIEYIPRTGKNRGVVYEQFYKGDKCRLFVWLRDTSEVIDGELYKKDLQGTYWDMNAWMKNLTKEGSVEFGNGKKPEQLIRQIFEMTTSPGDWVLDSFLGSGTTAAVATKMGRKWIGIELGDHAYTHCKVRLDRVVDGTDSGGITKPVDWHGGGGYALKRRLDNIAEFKEIKQMEYEAITHHNDPAYASNKKHFKAEEEYLPDYLKPYFSRIIRVTRLREVKVLLGFMRVDAPDPDADEQPNVVKLSKGRTGDGEKWLPAAETHGEGIFIEFNRQTLDRWLESVRALSEKYAATYREFCESKGWTITSERNAIYVMMHTFAHLMIKQMSMSSGYSSTAIRERIYFSDRMAGILFYTGSADKEGSLGGLVELGTVETLAELMRDAFQEALLCTNDPECLHNMPAGKNSNGAACHSCCMISETACENGNRMLDRGLVVPIAEREDQAYFRELVIELCQLAM